MAGSHVLKQEGSSIDRLNFGRSLYGGLALLLISLIFLIFYGLGALKTISSDRVYLTERYAQAIAVTYGMLF